LERRWLTSNQFHTGSESASPAIGSWTIRRWCKRRSRRQSTAKSTGRSPRTRDRTSSASAALHLILLWLRTGLAAESIHWAYQGVAFIALLFPAIAAALAGMEAHREHLRLEKRSANMAPQLEQLNKQMASATDPVRFESLLQQLDEIMLRETQDWLMLMRYAEIKAS
jgi:hypothetical protein